MSIRASNDYPSTSSSGMPASTSAYSLSAHRLPVPYHRRSDSANSSTSSNSSNSTAVAGLSVRSSGVKRGPSVSPSKQHAAVILAAKRASMRGTPSKTASSSSSASSSSGGSSSALPVPIIVAPAPAPAPKATSSRSILMEDDYQEEVVAHMHSLEAKTLPNLELMNAQPELRWFMRPYLVDFLLEIHQTFRLRPETLYLTMNIVDRYVSKRIVFKRHYQLVGSAALLIATKYEDAKDRVPTVADLSSMCCQAYDESAFLQMEGHILQTLGWQLGHPTSEAWMRMLCREEDARTQSVARFLMELTLYHRDFIGYAPSVVAAGALMLARFVCQSNVAPLAMQADARGRDACWMGADVDEVASVAQMIDGLVAGSLNELSATLVKKYSYQHFCAASTVVKTFYLARLAAQKAAAERLLPAHSLRAGASHKGHDSSDDIDVDADCTMASSSSSSFTSSGTSTPSSMASTPSRSRAGECSDDDDDDDDDDDEDMPVTPLSLTALHDPLAAAAVNMESPTMARASKQHAHHLAPHHAQQHQQQARPALPVRSSYMPGSQSMPRLPSSLGGGNKAAASQQQYHQQQQPQHQPQHQQQQHYQLPTSTAMKSSTSASSFLSTSSSSSRLAQRSRLTLRSNPSWQS